MGFFSSDPVTHFPLVEGRRLDGTDVRFPQDLPADATLAVVLFQDALDPLADQWARLGDRLGGVYGDRFAVIETPIVSRKMKMLGDLGTMGIRGQIDSDAERDRTIPLYVDVKALRKTLGLKTGDVYAFLLARDGRIAWRGEGDIDMEEVQELEAATADVLAAPVPPVTDHPDLDAEEETENGEPHATDDGADEGGELAAGGPAADGSARDEGRGPQDDLTGPASETGEAERPPRRR